MNQEYACHLCKDYIEFPPREHFCQEHVTQMIAAYNSSHDHIQAFRELAEELDQCKRDASSKFNELREVKHLNAVLLSVVESFVKERAE